MIDSIKGIVALTASLIGEKHTKNTKMSDNAKETTIEIAPKPQVSL